MISLVSQIFLFLNTKRSNTKIMFSLPFRSSAYTRICHDFKTKPTEDDLRAYIQLRNSRLFAEEYFSRKYDYNTFNSTDCCIKSNLKIFNNPLVQRIECKKDKLLAALHSRYGVRRTIFGNSCNIDKKVVPAKKTGPCSFINKNKF